MTATVIGKPEPFVFEIARGTLRECDHVAGAKRSGLIAILVLTGTATRDDLEHAVIEHDFVLSSLAELRRSSNSKAVTTEAPGAPGEPAV